MSLISLISLCLLLVLGQGTYAELKSVDVGDAAEKPGSTEVLPDGSITVIGAGHDIWETQMDLGMSIWMISAVIL